MRCDQIAPYLPGFAGGELRADTRRLVSDHIDGCEDCATEAAVHSRVVASLATLSARELEPPPFLLESILESVGEHKVHRVIPVLPLPVAELARVVGEHKEAIASAAGTALVAAGAAYALWRAVRSPRSAQQPATS